MKTIKLNNNAQEDIITQFKDYLAKAKFNSKTGIFSFNVPETRVEKKPVLMITPEAYIKMNSLVQTTDSEIGWHGLIRRNKEENTYLLYDIIVYPQYVTSATVTTDDTEYAMWLQNHDDETFNSIRFHGHSHVRMTASPSGVDDGFYSSLIQNLGENDFYIFLIANKQGDIWVNIYDFENNVIYEKADVKLTVCLSDGQHGDDWADNERMAHVKERVIPKIEPVIVTPGFSKAVTFPKKFDEDYDDFKPGESIESYYDRKYADRLDKLDGRFVSDYYKEKYGQKKGKRR